MFKQVTRKLLSAEGKERKHERSGVKLIKDVADNGIQLEMNCMEPGTLTNTLTQWQVFWSFVSYASQPTVDFSKDWGKYLKHIKQVKNCYLEYIKNSYKSVRKRQFK